MAQTRDIINDKGEISREDYFFSAVKGNYPGIIDIFGW